MSLLISVYSTVGNSKFVGDLSRNCPIFLCLLCLCASTSMSLAYIAMGVEPPSKVVRQIFFVSIQNLLLRMLLTFVTRLPIALDRSSIFRAKTSTQYSSITDIYPIEYIIFLWARLLALKFTIEYRHSFPDGLSCCGDRRKETFRHHRRGLLSYATGRF